MIWRPWVVLRTSDLMALKGLGRGARWEFV